MNCSDVGENCKLLPYDFKKERDRWSNLNFVNVEGISEDCPLIHTENMDKNSPVKLIKHMRYDLNKDNITDNEAIGDKGILDLKGCWERLNEQQTRIEELEHKLECCEYLHLLKELKTIREKVEMGDYSDFSNLTMSKEDCKDKIIRW